MKSKEHEVGGTRLFGRVQAVIQKHLANTTGHNIKLKEQRERHAKIIAPTHGIDLFGSHCLFSLNM